MVLEFYCMRTALTIAGSDSGGGAGIQADLKTFAACGVYGTSAITAVTAQNTLGVTAWEPVSTELVIAQIEAVGGDLPPAAVKTGMLATAAIVEAVAATIEELDLPNLVVDPVMIAKGGDRLLDEDAVAAIKAELLTLAEVVTPNVPEAEVLTGMSIRDARRHARRRAADPGARPARRSGEGRPPADRRPGDRRGLHARAANSTCAARGSTRGTRTGPAARSRRRLPRIWRSASRSRRRCRSARAYLEGAIRHAPGLGAGHGPLNHFWRLY